VKRKARYRLAVLGAAAGLAVVGIVVLNFSPRITRRATGTCSRNRYVVLKCSVSQYP
jgi:hypothetical protein